jgi:hypothetical protein
MLARAVQGEGFAELKGVDIRKFSTLSLLSLFRRILNILQHKMNYGITYVLTLV